MIFRRLLLALAATTLAGAALGQTAPSADIAKVVSAWRERMNSYPSVQTAPAPGASLAEQLKFRTARDQAGREALSVVSDSALTTDQQRLAMEAIWKELHAIDDENTAWLTRVIPADGWFRISRDGARTTTDAWLIVQHSRDRALQRRVLVAMDRLVRIGEVNGGEYALLYDRNAMFDGLPQRYGSQGTCVNGVMNLHTLEDAAKVEEWRRAVGLNQTLAEYAPLIGVGKPC
jgi:hypothetical protein